VSQELIRIKDFASDKLVDDLCSHKVLKGVMDAMDERTVTGNDEDAAALLCLLFFMKLHLSCRKWPTCPCKTPCSLSLDINGLVDNLIRCTHHLEAKLSF
jgi:hypothetical protein